MTHPGYSEFFKRPLRTGTRIATAEDLAPEPQRPTAAARCIERTHGGPCHQQPDFFREDGRCYLHGKLADRLMESLNWGYGAASRLATGRADG